MSKEIEKVRRQLESRRRKIHDDVRKRERKVPMVMNRSIDEREDIDFYIAPEGDRPSEPTGNKGDFFLFRAMVAVCLFLVCAIVFRSGVPQVEAVKSFVQQTYETELEFALIANWYENQFGRPLALVPMNQDVAQGDPNEQVELVYAVPASGIISEGFDQTGQGIFIETGLAEQVEAVKAGAITSVGEGKTEYGQSLGKTVTVAHYDGTESIYGMLDEVEVNMYDHIQSGQRIGTVSATGESDKGVFYFALKKDGEYIDPSDVITFD